MKHIDDRIRRSFGVPELSHMGVRMVSRDELVKRAQIEADAEQGNHWTNFCDMMENKEGIGITSRGEYSSKEWNWLQQVKSQLVNPWE